MKLQSEITYLSKFPNMMITLITEMIIVMKKMILRFNIFIMMLTIMIHSWRYMSFSMHPCIPQLNMIKYVIMYSLCPVILKSLSLRYIPYMYYMYTLWNMVMIISWRHIGLWTPSENNTLSYMNKAGKSHCDVISDAICIKHAFSEITLDDPNLRYTFRFGDVIKTAWHRTGFH